MNSDLKPQQIRPKQKALLAQLLFSCMTIFVSCLHTPVSAQNVIDSNDHIQKAVKKKQTLYNSINSKTFYTIEELSNGPYSTFKGSRFFHGCGDWHSDIFRIHKNNKSYLIKTTLPGTPGYGDEDYFKSHLLGYLLAEGIGGPAITRSGRFKNAEGVKGYFVEMEELFANDRSTFTYKGIRKFHNKIIQRLSFRILSEAHIKNLAKLLIKALENGLYLDDLDFIFSSKSSEVRWFDTTHWLITSTLGSDHLEHIRTLFKDLRMMNKKYSDELWAATMTEIENSQIWSTQQKTNMKKSFKDSLFHLAWFRKELGCASYLEQ